MQIIPINPDLGYYLETAMLSTDYKCGEVSLYRNYIVYAKLIKNGELLPIAAKKQKAELQASSLL